MPDAIVKFRKYVESLPRDAKEVLAIATDKKLPKAARRHAVAALNYLLLQLDLVPDWVPVIGLCDDAFVLRAAMALLADQDPQGLSVEQMAVLGRLANEADEVRAFLGDDLNDLLRGFVIGLGDREIARRVPDRIVTDDKALAAWKRDIEGHLRGYKPDVRPMQDPEKLERELLAYFRTKLQGKTT
ncbi:MAG: DUF1232 domain-containing protein [Deltaproteobacteria bacterium]|nr:DUF1232 domain-containing protein [Deltaproteobacteria bacterium]